MKIKNEVFVLKNLEMDRMILNKRGFFRLKLLSNQRSLAQRLVIKIHELLSCCYQLTNRKYSVKQIMIFVC